MQIGIWGGGGGGGHHEGLLRDVFGLRFKKNWQVRWDEIRNHVVALASFFCFCFSKKPLHLFFSYKWIGPYLAFLYSDHSKSFPPLFFFFTPSHIHPITFTQAFFLTFVYTPLDWGQLWVQYISQRKFLMQPRVSRDWITNHLMDKPLTLLSHSHLKHRVPHFYVVSQLGTNRAQSCLVSQIRWECLGCYDHELRQEVCYSLPETNTKNLALQISVNMMETE